MSATQEPKWRLFAAVFPGGEAAAELAQLLAPLWAGAPQAGLRWLSSESLHVTLQFFGAVPEARVSALAAGCARAAASSGPFELRFAGAGAFPSLRRARVLWLGVAQGARELAQLSAAVASEARPVLGAAPVREEQAFTPHLSVARLSTALDAAPLAAALQSASVSMQVEQLALVRSTLGGKAARYEVIERFGLAVGCR
jgi:RNA 2',3'-cyclic 3'-phosphodiesterase